MIRKLSDKLEEGLTRHCYICITRRRKDVLMWFFIGVMVNGSKHGYKQKLGTMLVEILKSVNLVRMIIDIGVTTE
jgi:hypothetical protein